MGERGQTQQDYVVGVSIFLLTTAGVFSFVPGIFSPFQDPTVESEEAMATRVTEGLFREHTVPGTDQTLNYSSLQAQLDDFNSSVTHNVKDTRLVNVTIHNRTGQVLSGGSPYSPDSGPTASTVRIVRFRSNSSCQTGCRLVVRVWS